MLLKVNMTDEIVNQVIYYFSLFICRINTKLIELIDGYKLLQYIKMAKMDNDEYFKKEIEVCPKCGGSLIERSGKYGKFFGCSNYPKCNFTKN